MLRVYLASASILLFRSFVVLPFILPLFCIKNENWYGSNKVQENMVPILVLRRLNLLYLKVSSGLMEYPPKTQPDHSNTTVSHYSTYSLHDGKYRRYNWRCCRGSDRQQWNMPSAH
ncbi:hypothetical protein F5B20DRAFT_563453 [Whalleya microplaca]|nr:hypothetical protein F5B20DRAFT_563453 [Whalleya microplaca]